MPVRAVPNIHRLTLALLAALALPAFAQQSTEQVDASGKSVKTLDRMTVTGSRIRRADIEEISHQINVYMKGNSSDNLASNAGIVNEEQRGNNGVSGANLRGQGADATLVLLNGRRVATHGLKGRAVDLNSIPFAAIERVEVLRDGASAIYGTDAIGGVINFITKRDFQGAQASAFFDYTEAGGGNIQRGTLLFGHGDLDRDRWNAFGSVSVKRNTILRGSDRDFSNTFQPRWRATTTTRTSTTCPRRTAAKRRVRTWGHMPTASGTRPARSTPAPGTTRPPR